MTTDWSTTSLLTPHFFTFSIKNSGKNMSKDTRTPAEIRDDKCARSHERNISRKATKRAQAETRQELRDVRSSQEQLAVLDARFGKNKGAKKERARLAQNA
ncbi:MAG: hypothetical protein WC098_07845 [Bacteroidales bacterium]